MNHFTHRNPSHRIHTDIQPILSALKHGKRRIAQSRYRSLCEKLNLMKWESVVVANIVRSTSIKKGIPFR
jgi:hypothetical protein